jgi:hypothetical protein
MEARSLGVTWARTFAILGLCILLPFSVFIGIALKSWLGAFTAFGSGALAVAAVALRAAFIIRVDELSVEFLDQESFLRAVNQTLSSVGYRPLSGNAEVLVAKPAGLGFLAPVINVVIRGASATFTGPRERVRRLARYLSA